MFPIGICADFDNLPAAHDLGFDFLEISLAQLAALPEKDYLDLVQYVEKKPLRIAACRQFLPDDLPITGLDVKAAELHGYLKHAFARAARLNIRTACLDAAKSRMVPFNVDFPYAWRQLGNFLRLTEGHASESGINVVIEPLRKGDCNLLNLVTEATMISGMLQLRYINVMANTGSMGMASEPLSALRQAMPLLQHIHVETPLTREMPRTGDGEDYVRLFKTLAEIGYAGGVSISGKRTQNFAKDAAAALRRLRQANEQAEAEAAQ